MKKAGFFFPLYNNHLVAKTRECGSQEAVEKKGADDQLRGREMCLPVGEPILDIIRSHQMLSPSLGNVL